jgi:hypothetical protein
LFGLVATGYDASIVVAKYHYRFVVERWLKQPFATTVKIIAIYNGLHAFVGLMISGCRV